MNWWSACSAVVSLDNSGPSFVRLLERGQYHAATKLYYSYACKTYANCKNTWLDWWGTHYRPAVKFWKIDKAVLERLQTGASNVDKTGRSCLCPTFSERNQLEPLRFQSEILEHSTTQICLICPTGKVNSDWTTWNFFNQFRSEI